VSGHWLAIDTATSVASVAVGRPPAVEAAGHVEGARRHAAELLRLVDFCLGRAAVTPKDLEGIVIGDGPGSFTGLRIGWATAKGLAQETGVEVRAVPSLMAVAAGVAASAGEGPVAVWFDALRGQVYAATYVIHTERVETLLAPRLIRPEDCAREAPYRPLAVAGDGAVRYADAATQWSGRPPVVAAVTQGAVMLLALLTRGAGRAIDDFAAAEPEYGRPAEAQVKWEARHGRPLPDPSRPSR